MTKTKALRSSNQVSIIGKEEKELDGQQGTLSLAEKHELKRESFQVVPHGIHPAIREKYPSDCALYSWTYDCTGDEKHENQRPLYAVNIGRDEKGNFKKDENGLLVLEAIKDHARHCPICSGMEAGKKARAALEEINNFKWNNLRFLELTSPSDFVNPDKIDDEEYCKQRVKDFFKLAQEYMTNMHEGESYILAFQHWSSERPLGSPHFHMHIISSCTQYWLEIEKRHYKIMTKANGPRMTRKQLDEARAVWAGLLELPEGKDSTVNYAYHPRKEVRVRGKKYGGVGRLKHRLNYMYRSYIGDVDKFMTNFSDQSLSGDKAYDLEEKFTKDQDKWLTWHMKKWPRRIRRYGAFSNKLQQYYINKFDMRRRKEKREVKESERYCRVCEKPLKKLRNERDLTLTRLKLLALCERTLPVDEGPLMNVVYYPEGDPDEKLCTSGHYEREVEEYAQQTIDSVGHSMIDTKYEKKKKI